MRNKALLLALVVVVACGAGPFRGGFGRGVASSAVQPVAQSAVQSSAIGAAAFSAQQGARANEVAQIVFKGSDGMQIQWDVAVLGDFASTPLVCPGTQNFQTAKSYRLKLSNIPNRPELTLYPTLTINAVTPRTRAYLDHNAIPVKFSEADFDQIQNGNFVTKVVFLPSQKYQNLALAGGVDTIVNTQLPAGADPIVEAQNRGAILAVVQIGNKDLSLDDSFAGAAVAVSEAQQIPISGVNAPAFGTPASESANAVAEIPTVATPRPQPTLQRLSPNPSTGVPSVLDTTWNDSKF